MKSLGYRNSFDAVAYYYSRARVEKLIQVLINSKTCRIDILCPNWDKIRMEIIDENELQ